MFFMSLSHAFTCELCNSQSNHLLRTLLRSWSCNSLVLGGPGLHEIHESFCPSVCLNTMAPFGAFISLCSLGFVPCFVSLFSMRTPMDVRTSLRLICLCLSFPLSSDIGGYDWLPVVVMSSSTDLTCD